MNIYGTNPNNADTDDDGISDSEEIDTGTNPISNLDNIWVDFAWAGNEIGTISEPYKTLPSATGAVISGDNVWIDVPGSATSTPWVGTIDTRLTLNASGGTATIGTP